MLRDENEKLKAENINLAGELTEIQNGNRCF
jgi:hypothetical protein